MTLNRDDYERAIARIFYKDSDIPVGTGFLVAPGYLLTCAHVVLQAIGVEEEDFETYVAPPDRTIKLDFPVCSETKIQARVMSGGRQGNWYSWKPYRITNGDIAALKLQSPEPEGVKPIPVAPSTLSQIEADEHSVYGFAHPGGGRSDAYTPKANVAGGRYQFCKAGNPDDETIESGFSGAPVWIDRCSAVIGMVATARVVQNAQQKSMAHVIPQEKLQPLLATVLANHLHDLLEREFSACRDVNERFYLRSAVEAALQQCNPSERDLPWLEQLENLSADRAPYPGWEEEGHLVRFVMMLAWMDSTPAHTYDQLKEWVERQGLEFPDLLERLTREMRVQRSSSINACSDLMVVVQPAESSGGDPYVSMWAIDRTNYNPQSPPLPLVDKVSKSLQDLPEFVKKTHRSRFGPRPLPIVHLFVPRSLLCCDVEMQPFGRLKERLGSAYPFVLRTNLSVHPIGQWYYEDWHEKWQTLIQSLDELTCDVFDDVDCEAISNPDLDLLALMDRLSEQQAAILRNCSSFEELFGLLSEERESALPVAVWSRDSRFEGNLPDLLDCVVRRFPGRVRQERERAKRARDRILLGHHLSLVWEDPTVIPPGMQPNMQFNPEAC